MDRFAQGVDFMKRLTANFGEPVNLSPEDLEAYLQNNILSVPLPSDTFYILFNIKEVAFTFLHGTDSFFGHKEISYHNFITHIEPSFREMFMTWGEGAYTAALDPESKKVLMPLKQEYRTMIPMRNREGKYYWVTQIARPIQFDADMNLISHLNIYRVGIGFEGWKNWAMKGEIFEKHLPLKELTFRMNEYVHAYVAKTFGDKKMEMLQLYAKGDSTEEVAKKMSITKTTVYTHNKGIIAKANQLFQKNFLNVKEAATNLSEKGYLGMT